MAGVRLRRPRQAGQLNLDLFWLKDKSLEESDDLPPPGVLAAEIAADLESATERFTAIAGKLGGG